MDRSIRPLGLHWAGPRWQKGDVMFRKIAIALVATSVLAAPVLAQGTVGDSKVSPTTPPTTSIVPKSEKAITKVTKHRMVVRHHRHGTKLAKYTKSHGAKMGKYAKYGKYTHPKHGKTSSAKFMSSARASAKPISSKVSTKRSFSKPAAKQGVD
jgi:hypothetical protein